jgi:hypothetical protein
MDNQLPAWRVFAVIAGIYTVQSTAGAITFQGVPVVLRAAGAPLDLIGLISLFMLPWAVKFLWAPAVERWRLPAAGGRRSRPIILIGQVLIAIVFAALSLAAPDGGLAPLLIGLALIALLAATVDIACDAFRAARDRQARLGQRHAGRRWLCRDHAGRAVPGADRGRRLVHGDARGRRRRAAAHHPHGGDA